MRQARFLLAAFLFEGLLSVGAIGLGWLVGISPWYRAPGETFGVELLARDLLWGLAATAPLVAVLLLEEHPLWRSLTDLKDQVSGLLHRLLHAATLPQLFILALLAGLGEELLFRGLLQTGLAHLLPARFALVGSLLIASIIFGACHYLSHTYFVLATVAGLYFGLLMIVSGSIVPPIIAHALYDFVALVYLLSEPQVEHCCSHLLLPPERFAEAEAEPEVANVEPAKSSLEDEQR